MTFLSEIFSFVLLKAISIFFFLIILFFLLAFLGVLSRSLKFFFKNFRDQIDNGFLYIYIIIFYLFILSKGLNIFLENYNFFSSESSFLSKFLNLFFSQTTISVTLFFIIYFNNRLLILFGILSGIKMEDLIEDLSYKESYFKGYIILVPMPILALIVSVFVSALKSHNFIFQLLAIIVFFIILMVLFSLLLEYFKIVRNRKCKFLIKGSFVDGNNIEGSFNFSLINSKYEDKLFVKYQEFFPNRKLNLNFYLNKHNQVKLFYDDYNNIDKIQNSSLSTYTESENISSLINLFSLIFFDKNQNLKNNKIFLLNFSLPIENITKFYYKDNFVTYSHKKILLYETNKIKYHPYCFLKKSDGFFKVNFNFAYLEANIANKQNFFIKDCENNTILTSFENIKQYLSEYDFTY